MSWILFALLSAVFAAAVAIFGKLGMKGIDTTLATSVRAIVMAVFLVSVSVSLGKWKLLGTLDNKALLYIGLSGVAGALSWLCYFFALKYGPTTAVASLDKMSVVFVLVLAALFLGEAFTWRIGLGAALVTLGTILITLK